MGRERYYCCFTCRPQFSRCRAHLRTERGYAIVYFSPPTQHQNLSILYMLCTFCQTARYDTDSEFTAYVLQKKKQNKKNSCHYQDQGQHVLLKQTPNTISVFPNVKWNRLKFLKMSLLTCSQRTADDLTAATLLTYYK